MGTRRPNDTVDTSLTVEWRNELDTAFLPNDPTLMGAVMPGEPVPTVTHLHGGENHPQFDGTPLQWFTRGGDTGPHYLAKIWPFVDVEPRRYRLRLVNGSQSRFYNLSFADEKSGRTLPFTQIGTEGGLLRAPVPLTALLIAPGERADLIIDFRGKADASFIVTNNARAPYPMGGRAGLSQLLMIRVNRPLQGTDATHAGGRAPATDPAGVAGPRGDPRAASVGDARPADGCTRPPQR